MCAMDFVNYKRKLMAVRHKNVFKDPWGGVILRNMDGKGKLVKYKNLSAFKRKRSPVWIRCQLKIFQDEQNPGSFQPIYICSVCPKMKCVSQLGLNQNPRHLKSLRCIHSKMVQEITEDWGHWNI